MSPNSTAGARRVRLTLGRGFRAQIRLEALFGAQDGRRRAWSRVYLALPLPASLIALRAAVDIEGAADGR